MFVFLSPDFLPQFYLRVEKVVMTAWAAIRRFAFVIAIALLGVFALPSLSLGADPLKAELKPERPAKPTPDQLRDIAAKAEQAGDWEAAFNAYCHLFVVDRASPDLREKL